CSSDLAPGGPRRHGRRARREVRREESGQGVRERVQGLGPGVGDRPGRQAQARGPVARRRRHVAVPGVPGAEVPATGSLMAEPGRDRGPETPKDLTKPSWFYVLRKTAREFSEDQCTDLAPALTYYSILALFPAALAVRSEEH